MRRLAGSPGGGRVGAFVSARRAAGGGVAARPGDGWGGAQCVGRPRRSVATQSHSGQFGPPANLANPLQYRPGTSIARDVVSRQMGSREGAMLWTIAVILLVLWALGMFTAYTAGGLVHLLLVIALIVVVFQFISGRRAI